MLRTPVAVLSVLAVASPAAAARFSVMAGTVAWGDQVVGGDGRVVPRRRLVQRLGLVARPAAADPWTFRSDLRLGTDTALDVPALRPRGVQARTVELLYAALSGRGLMGGAVDVTLGRQLRWEAADLSAFDGVHVAVRGPLHLGAEAHSGLVVRREASYLGYSDLEPDGTVTAAEQTPTVGAGLFVHGSSLVRGRGGWRRRWRSGHLAGDRLHGSAVIGPLGAAQLDGRVRYDLALRRTEHAEVGLSAALLAWADVEVRAARLRPAFELDSIFPYFAAGPSDDLSLAARVHRDHLSGWVRATGRWFSAVEDAADAEGLPAGLDEAAAATGVGAGLTVGNARRLGVTVWRQSGYGGAWLSSMVHGVATSLGGRLEVDGRLRWTRYESDLLVRHAGDALQAVAGASWGLSQQARFHVTGELDVTPVAAPSIRLLGLLDLGFSL